MNSWQEVRDWEVVEAINSLGKDSWDFIGRDIWLEKGSEAYKVDFIRYRRNGYKIEARWIYSEEAEATREEAMESLRAARDILESESFVPRLTLSSLGGFKPSYNPDITGNYFFDSEADRERVVNDMESVIAETFESNNVSRIRCKN